MFVKSNYAFHLVNGLSFLFLVAVSGCVDPSHLSDPNRSDVPCYFVSGSTMQWEADETAYCNLQGLSFGQSAILAEPRISAQHDFLVSRMTSTWT